MSGSNHVAGGIVFTGIFASFWNINIFSTPALLFFTAFCAVLPDIDHLKSPIGKLFYPVAKWLDRRYGHRTITHSLVVYISLLFLVMFIENALSRGYTFTLIYSFAYFSHLLFDMLTKQGIPLFYPFKKNACVIPGNPDLRLRSSDLKTEAACFAIFVLLGISCQSLFANGFWNTYNKQFSDLKHLHQESRQSDNLLTVEYKIKASNGSVKSGKGLLVESSDSKAVLLEKGTFSTIEKEDKIIALTPIRTNKTLLKDDLLFNNISADSLNKILKNLPIVALKLQCNTEASYIKDKKPTKGKNIELEYLFNPIITFNEDSLNNSIRNRIEILNFELKRQNEEKTKKATEKAKIQSKIEYLSNSIPEMGNYEREKATKELAKSKAEFENFTDFEDNTGKILLQLQHLKAELEANNKAQISGYVQFLNLSKN